jgi:pentalenolactone synthase
MIRRVTTPAGDPAWQVSDYQLIRRLLTDERLGHSLPEPARAARYSRSVLFGQARQATPTERTDHLGMRRMLAPAFSARRLALLRHRVRELVDGLLDDLPTGEVVDFHEAVSFPLPALVICELLGVPFADRADFRRWSDEAADMTDPARSAAGLAELRRYMAGLLGRKLAEPAQDVLSDLVAAHRQHPDAVPLDRLTMLAAGLLFAGHETTVAAIDAGTVLLATHPARQSQVRRAPELVSPLVEEILRLDLSTPDRSHEESTGEGGMSATGLTRWAAEDLEIDGTTVRAGELVLLDLRGANQDPAVFPEPRTFDPARSGSPHLTFGHGAHYCVGAPLARIELRALFGTLLRRYAHVELAVPPDQLQPRSELLTGGLHALPVLLTT